MTRGASKTVYGDDLVHVLLWCGFQYKALVERSYQKLQGFRNQGKLITTLQTATQKAGFEVVTLRDAAEAIQEVEESLTRILRGGFDHVEGPRTPQEDGHKVIWEPLVVGGQRVRGAKVYIGDGDPNDSHAPVPGSIYLDGVKLGEKVLEPAPNGPWLAKQKAKTVAKEILRSWLPSGLYVRYCLDPKYRQELRVGREAGQHAKGAGVIVEPESIRALFKVAP